MSNNNNLHAAKRAKNDEFYTRYEDIENELQHYKDFFSGKSVYCNCDSPTESNFPRYFLEHFDELGLESLTATCYVSGGCDWKGTKTKGGNYTVEQLQGDGDFRSKECVELLKEADVVVTNPPFSLFREYVKLLMDYGKKFLIIGSKNALTYKEVFPLIKENKLWVGVTPMSQDMKFVVPDEYAEEVVKTKKEGSAYVIKDGQVLCRAQAIWFTNLDHDKRNIPIDLYKRYSNEEYPKYDNYDAIEVSKVADIPEDYDGVMGVPITFLDKYNPEQFEIVGATESEGSGFSNGVFNGGDTKQALVKGQRVYKRLFIKRVCTE